MAKETYTHTAKEQYKLLLSLLVACHIMNVRLLLKISHFGHRTWTNQLVLAWKSPL